VYGVCKGTSKFWFGLKITSEEKSTKITIKIIELNEF
jgi:hypothetical protein